MKRLITPVAMSIALVLSSVATSMAQGGADPLPSWNDGALKDRIVAWVDRVTDEANAEFVPVAERVAVFDIDGTLWAERPYYLDALFAADRVRELAADNPGWADQLPYAPIVAGDYDVLNSIASADFIRLIAASYGTSTDAEWEGVVEDWFDTSTNSVLGRVHASDTYLPMMELLELVKSRDFTPYLVTAADEQFIRAVSDEIFGIPPEQVIGNELQLTVTDGEDGVTVTRTPVLATANEREGKVVQILDVVGRKPILAAGNSDGDYWMMKWTTTGDDDALALLVQHDDATREFEYTRKPTLATAAVESDPEWAAVSIKDAWETVFAEQ